MPAARRPKAPWQRTLGATLRPCSNVPETTLDFTGQRRDGTGLLFYNARYYDPALGKFLSPDTIVPGAAAQISRDSYGSPYAAESTSEEWAPLDEARAKRNERADELAELPRSQRPATVSAGWDTANPEAGIAVGCSGGGRCAEQDVVDQLKPKDPSSVRFTEAVRSWNTDREIPICENCQARYNPEQFPEGTRSEPGGRWSQIPD